MKIILLFIQLYLEYNAGIAGNLTLNHLHRYADISWCFLDLDGSSYKLLLFHRIGLILHKAQSSSSIPYRTVFVL